MIEIVKTSFKAFLVSLFVINYVKIYGVINIGTFT